MNCPNCDKSYDLPTVAGRYICGQCGQEYRVSTFVAPPADTCHCPGCELAGQQIAEIHARVTAVALNLRKAATSISGHGGPLSEWVAQQYNIIAGDVECAVGKAGNRNEAAAD